MKQFILVLLILPLSLLALNKESQKIPEKRFKVTKPVLVENLDEEVKEGDEGDLKKHAKEGASTEGRTTQVDPHHFKDVRDNSRKTQKIDKNIDPKKFMQGLGDKNKPKPKAKQKAKNRKPSLMTSPYMNQRRLQKISNGHQFKEQLLSGNVHLRFHLFSDQEDTEKHELRLEGKFDLSVQKQVSNHLFKATIGTPAKTKSAYTVLNMLQSDQTVVSLKEAYYQGHFFHDALVYRMGRYYNNTKSDYFYSSDISFDGLNVFGYYKGFHYDLIGSILNSREVVNNTQAMAGLGQVSLGYSHDHFNIQMSYALLYGKELNNQLKDTMAQDPFEDSNHFLHAHACYRFDFMPRSLSVFLAGSYNLTADDDQLGGTLGLFYQSALMDSKISFVYKQKNAVISSLSLQEDYFSNDIMGGNFNLTFKLNDYMNISADILVGKSISNENGDLNYSARLAHSLTF